MIRKYLFVLFLILGNYSFGQISQGGLPYSLRNSLKSSPCTKKLSNENLPISSMPKIDESKIQKLKENNKTGNKVFQFAIGFDVTIDVKQSSKIDSTETGLLYRMIIYSEGAYSINLIFGEYEIPMGAELFIYSYDKENVIGAFTSNNNKKNRKFSTQLIKGDKIVLEYFEPYFTSFKGVLKIEKISHDFINTLKLIKDGQYGNSGDCNIDINCGTGNNWQNQKRSVCKIIINGTGLCTGAVINNTNSDGEPYFLTANHCICSQSGAENSVFIFNYESGDGAVNQSIDGADLIANRANSDFSLLKLSKIPPSVYNPYYAGWDNRTNSPTVPATCIHHPSGDVKKISVTNNNLTTASVNFYDGSGCDVNVNKDTWRVSEWTAGLEGKVGVTEGGSSGAPLFDNSQRIIGQLYGGAAYCDNPYNDYYGKLSTSWETGTTNDTRLREWLDPMSTNLQYIDGSGICSEGIYKYLNLTNDINNGMNVSYSANTIEASNTIKSGAIASYQATELTLKPGFKAESGSSFSAKAVIRNCVPGCYPINLTAWTSYVVQGSDLCYNITNATYFDVYVYTISGQLVSHRSGNFYSNQICVWNTGGTATGIYLVNVLFRNDCSEISKSYQLLVASSTKSAELSLAQNCIDLNIIDEKTDFAQDELKKLNFKIYPNPSNGNFTVEILQNNNNLSTIELINSFGQIVFRKNNIIDNIIEVKKSDLPKGIYLVKVSNNSKSYSKAIIIQ